MLLAADEVLRRMRTCFDRAIFRIRSRHRRDEEKVECLERERQDACVCVQRIWRGVLCRRLLRGMRNAEVMVRRKSASCTLQSAWRCKTARLVHRKVAVTRQIECACCVLQSVWLCTTARRCAREQGWQRSVQDAAMALRSACLRHLESRRQTAFVLSACVLQRGWRVHRAKVLIVEAKIRQKQRQAAAVLPLQTSKISESKISETSKISAMECARRGQTGKEDALSSDRMGKEVCACVLLQKTFRGHAARWSIALL